MKFLAAQWISKSFRSEGSLRAASQRHSAILAVDLETTLNEIVTVVAE